MNRTNNEYTAVQTEEGFQIKFHDSKKDPLNVSFSDLQVFVDKINKDVLKKKEVVLTQDEEVLLRLWQMLLIPENVKH